MHTECEVGTLVQVVYNVERPKEAKKWRWFKGTVKDHMLAPGANGAMQLKVHWEAQPRWRFKEAAHPLEVREDCPFPERPLQTCTRENALQPRTLWTDTWLEQPDVSDEQRTAVMLNIHLWPGQ